MELLVKLRIDRLDKVFKGLECTLEILRPKLKLFVALTRRDAMLVFSGVAHLVGDGGEPLRTENVTLTDDLVWLEALELLLATRTLRLRIPPEEVHQARQHDL